MDGNSNPPSSAKKMKKGPDQPIKHALTLTMKQMPKEYQDLEEVELEYFNGIADRFHPKIIWYAAWQEALNYRRRLWIHDQLDSRGFFDKKDEKTKSHPKSQRRFKFKPPTDLPEECRSVDFSTGFDGMSPDIVWMAAWQEVLNFQRRSWIRDQLASCTSL